jgi:hypothetical protein
MEPKVWILSSTTYGTYRRLLNSTAKTRSTAEWTELHIRVFWNGLHAVDRFIMYVDRKDVPTYGTYVPTVDSLKN